MLTRVRESGVPGEPPAPMRWYVLVQNLRAFPDLSKLYLLIYKYLLPALVVMPGKNLSEEPLPPLTLTNRCCFPYQPQLPTTRNFPRWAWPQQPPSHPICPQRGPATSQAGGNGAPGGPPSVRAALGLKQRDQRPASSTP